VPKSVEDFFSRSGFVFLIAAVCLVIASAFPAPMGQEMTVRADGTLILKDATEIPPYAAGGNWVEGNAKHSDRFMTRHFLFDRPGGPPAVELFVTSDLAGEKPDGVFEMALIEGFLKSFSAGMRLTYGAAAVDDATVGKATVKRYRVELRNADTRIWLYAYVFAHQPSLLFLAIRPRSDAAGSIEQYLTRVQFKDESR